MISRPSSFLSMFVKSPFKRLAEHMGVVQQAVALLESLFIACHEEDWQQAEKIYKQISKHESEADALKRKIRHKIHHDLYLPVSRTELLVLLDVQDCIANKAEDISLLMLSRKMSFPASVHEKIYELMVQAVKTAHKAQDVSVELSDLVETGFKGLTIRSAKRLINDLYALENQSDQLQVQARQAVFAQESHHPALDVIFWYDCINQIGSLADWSRRVGTQLLLLSSR